MNPLLTPNRRLQLLSNAVSVRVAGIAASPTSASLVLHALERLHLEPSCRDQRRWRNMGLLVTTTPWSQADIRTSVNALHTLTLMVTRAYPALQHTVVPHELADGLQLLQRTVDDADISIAISSSQCLMLTESVQLLRRLQLQYAPLHEALRSRAPALLSEAAMHRNARDLSTVLRVVIRSPLEFGRKDVVDDLHRKLHSLLHAPRPQNDAGSVGQLTHQDAMVLLDAMTLRHHESGTLLRSHMLLQAVPAPLQPLLSLLYSKAVACHREISVAQAAAWFSRLVEEHLLHGGGATALIHSRNRAVAEAGESLLAAPALGLSQKDVDIRRQLLESLLAKFARTGFAKGLTISALRGSILALSHMWAQPAQETDNVVTRHEQWKQFVDHRSQKVWFGAANVLQLSVSALTTLLQEAMSRVRAACDEPSDDLMKLIGVLLSVPVALLAESDTCTDAAVGAASAIVALLKAKPSILTSSSDSRVVVLMLVFVANLSELLLLRRRRSTRDGTKRPSATGVLSAAGGGEGAAIIVLLRDAVGVVTRRIDTSNPGTPPLAAIDLVWLVNELTSRAFEDQRGSKDSIVMNCVRPLMNDAVRVMIEAIRGMGRESNEVNKVPRGQLVRAVTSLSKLGVRKRHPYHVIMQALTRPPLSKSRSIGHQGDVEHLTGFELVRLTAALARHQIDVPMPWLMDQLRPILACSSGRSASLLPAQKAMLLKSLGQLRVSWQMLQTIGVQKVDDIAPGGRETAPPTATLQVDSGNTEEQWIFPDDTRRKRQQRIAQSFHRRHIDAALSLHPHQDEDFPLRNFLCDLKVTAIPVVYQVQYVVGLSRVTGVAPPAAARLIVRAVAEMALQHTTKEAWCTALGSVESIALLGDFIAALLRVAAAESAHHAATDCVSTLLKAAVELLVERLPSSKHPFADLDQLVWWLPTIRSLRSPVVETGDVERLDNAMRCVLHQRVEDVAADPSLEPNTFVLRQLRMHRLCAHTSTTEFGGSSPAIRRLIQCIPWNMLVPRLQQYTAAASLEQNLRNKNTLAVDLVVDLAYLWVQGAFHQLDDFHRVVGVSNLRELLSAAVEKCRDEIPPVIASQINLRS